MGTRNPGDSAFIGLLVLVGIDVVVEGDMPPGSWELREGDTVIDSGRIEQEA